MNSLPFRAIQRSTEWAARVQCCLASAQAVQAVESAPLWVRCRLVAKAKRDRTMTFDRVEAVAVEPACTWALGTQSSISPPERKSQVE
jgi:hypothetical protein